MTKFIILTLIALLTGCNKPVEEDVPGRGGNTGGKDKVSVVTPTVELGKSDEDITKLKLKPGKLIGLSSVNETNCKRAVSLGLCIDIILNDATVFADNITDTKLEQYFIDAQKAIKASGVKVWGMHLPYQKLNLATINDDELTHSVDTQKKMIELSMKYLKPNHFVIHPSSVTIYSTDAHYSKARANSQKGMVQIQKHLDQINLASKTSAIICVENIPRGLCFDGKDMLDYLSAPGLEKTRVCLDTGHAIIPLNGPYRNPAANGNVVEYLRTVGTKLGTLHIQQNLGAVGRTGTLDMHVEPFSGGLVDWGEFYTVLLGTCLYRGCFLYETSYTDLERQTISTLDTVAENYKSVIYPAYSDK